MATTPKPITQMLEKTSLVDEDLFEIVDSAETNLSLKNKKVKFSSLKGQLPEQTSGTWTVASPSGGPTLTGTFGRYVKTGINVMLELQFTVPTNTDTNQVIIDAIPFTNVSSSLAIGTSIVVDSPSGNNIELHNFQVNNLQQLEFKSVSGTTNQNWTWQQASGKFVKASITYITNDF